MKTRPLKFTQNYEFILIFLNLLRRRLQIKLTDHSLTQFSVPCCFMFPTGCGTLTSVIYVRADVVGSAKKYLTVALRYGNSKVLPLTLNTRQCFDDGIAVYRLSCLSMLDGDMHIRPELHQQQQTIQPGPISHLHFKFE